MVIDIGVSLDGSWQRREFSSMNGVATAISIDTGKIIDIESMSRYCRQCFVIDQWKMTKRRSLRGKKATS